MLTYFCLGNILNIAATCKKCSDSVAFAFDILKFIGCLMSWLLNNINSMVNLAQKNEKNIRNCRQDA